MNTYVSREQRDAERAVEETRNLDSFAYWGDLPLGETWAFTFSRHRDSDSIQIDNFRVVVETMEEEFPDDFEIVSCSHWAVGWIDHLAVRMLDDEGKVTDAGLRVLEFKYAVEDYPLLDEMGHSERYFRCGGCGEDCSMEDHLGGPDEESDEWERDLDQNKGPFCKWCWDEKTSERRNLIEERDDLLNTEGQCPECKENTYVLMRVPPLEDKIETWCGHVVSEQAWLEEQGFDWDKYEEFV